MYICHIFFIQSIIDGHLGWFQVFATVNSVPQWAYLCMCLYNSTIYNPLDIYPVMGLSNGISNSRFLRNHPTVFHNGWTNLHFYQQCKSVPISPHLLRHLLFPDFFNECHSNWHEMVSQYGFELHFSNDKWWWAFFHVCWPYICLLLKSVYSCLSPTFEWGCLFCSCKSVLVLCRFWILAPCQLGRLQKFFPILLVAGSL